MSNQKYQIDLILDKYSSKKMSIRQATNCLVKKDMAKWKKQQKKIPKKEENAQVQGDEVVQGFRNDTNKFCKDLLSLAFEMFQIWDEKGYGRLRLQTICDNFLALGFSTDQDVTVSFFKGFLDQKKDLLT